MTFLNETKPSLEDVIEHHGVKGQKWGVHKSRTPTSSDIKDARFNIRQQGVAIRQQRKVVRRQKGAAAVKREKAKYDDMKASFLKDPDRPTSIRLTKGEKVAIGLLAATGVGAAGAASFVGTRVLVRKAVEHNVQKHTLNT